MTYIDLEQAERAERNTRNRPTVEGARSSWLQLASGRVDLRQWAEGNPPARKWAVDGLIPLGAVTLFSGDGELGKSTMALQLACSVIRGTPWLGCAVRHGRALVVSNEDDGSELWRRFLAIADGDGFDFSDLVEDLEVWDRVNAEGDSHIMTRGRDFGSWEDSAFWTNFSNFVRDFGPTVVVLDSLYDFFPGRQLDQADARLFMGKLRALAHDAETAIVILWHPSKSGMESGDGTSGNVAFRNASRSMLYVERADKDERDGPRIINQKKNNYGPTHPPITVQWEDGRFVPVVPKSGQGFVDRLDARRRVLEALAAALSSGEAPSAQVEARGNYLPKLLNGRPQVRGLDIREIERAMQDLRSSGDLVPGLTPDRPSRQRRILVPRGHPWAIAQEIDGG